MLQKVIRCVAFTAILVVSLWLIRPPPVAALSVTDYFQISYEPVSFSKSEIQGNETFHATIQGHATCHKDLPVSASEASITSRVIAKNVASGSTVTLNSSYTVTIKPFPSKEGDTIEINQVVPLKFPASAESGDYTITGKLVEAKVKVAFVWGEVTEYLPKNQPMGSVVYTALEVAPEATTEPKLTASSTEKPTSPEYQIVWWVWLIVAAAGATTVMNLIWFVRQRSR